MFRKKITGLQKHANDSIIWRGHEVTRIEAFSDAVFAFAITLLIVSLEVPDTYERLMESMASFVPFAICFLILFMIWYAQNMFFRRFGLHDIKTIVLNGMLLFVVLFFVYPLKFLFSGVFGGHFHLEGLKQAANLFYIYSGGFACIYILFALMYKNALKKGIQLKLTAIEIFETKTHLLSYLLIACVAVFSMFLAFLGGRYINFAGFAYMLIWPVVSILYSVRNRRKKFGDKQRNYCIGTRYLV